MSTRFSCPTHQVLAIGLSLVFFHSIARGQTSERTSSIRATATGTVNLKPTILRLSVPIKVIADTGWDAAENLRTVRRSVVERAEQMGAIEGSLQVFGFHCGPNERSSISSLRGEAKPTFAAQCFVVADFELREGEDHEETVGLSQEQLRQLASLLPEAESGRRSYTISSSSLPSGLTSQHLTAPLALFVAKVGEEDRAKALEIAIESAVKQVRSTFKGLGIEASSISFSQSPEYSSLRQTHPLESVLIGEESNEVCGVYADQVPYTVRVSVSGQFEPADMNW
jgi:hypothetical protein